MKKLLLSFLMVMAFVATAFADEATFDFTNPAGLSPSVETSDVSGTEVAVNGQTFTNAGVSLTFDKGTSKNDCRIWTTVNAVKDLRVYANSSFTVTAPAGKVVTKIAFTGSEVTKLSVTDGTFASQTWTGSVNAVNFSVTGTVKINTVTVTFGEEGSGTPTTPADDKTVLYSEAFDTGSGDFSIDDKNLPEGLTYVWKHDSSYKYMKASAYANSTAYASESWLVSPLIDLTKATECSLSFVQIANKFNSQENLIATCSVKAKAEGETEWTTLSLDQWASGTSWNDKPTSTADLSAFDGKKVQVAFVYTSTTDICGTWEVYDFAVSGKGEATVVPEVTTYTSIADLKAAATASGENIVFQFSDLLVAGVAKKGNNYSVYVTDGTEGMLLYGSNEPTVAKGDKISGSVTGKLKTYSTLTEIDAVDYAAVNVTSSDNEVQPVVAALADVKEDPAKRYENLLVRLEGIHFLADALASSNITMVDEDDNELTLRDNFGVLTDAQFYTDKAYNVTAAVAYFNGTPQLYPLSAEDVEVITNLKQAETAWAQSEVAILPGDDRTVDNALTTLSDGAKTFTSSDESVATVAADGTITAVGYGHAVITVETPETETYLESRASFDLYVIEGKGTLAEPYSIADACYFNGKLTEKVWVKGEISGFYKSGTNFVAGTTDAPETNLAIGTADLSMPVELPKGAVRTALNLKDNASNLGKTIWLYGNITAYFGTTGLKSVTDYSFDGETAVTSINGVEATAGRTDAIYTLDGRRVQKPVSGLYIVGGKKVFVK